MGTDTPPSRMIPGQHYRVSYVRGPQTTAVEGRYIGREKTASGDHLVLAPTTTRLRIPPTAVTLIQLIEPLPNKPTK